MIPTVQTSVAPLPIMMTVPFRWMEAKPPGLFLRKTAGFNSGSKLRKKKTNQRGSRGTSDSEGRCLKRAESRTVLTRSPAGPTDLWSVTNTPTSTQTVMTSQRKSTKTPKHACPEEVLKLLWDDLRLVKV